jgi:hypothetical protein
VACMRLSCSCIPFINSSSPGAWKSRVGSNASGFTEFEGAFGGAIGELKLVRSDVKILRSFHHFWGIHKA